MDKNETTFTSEYAIDMNGEDELEGIFETAPVAEPVDMIWRIGTRPYDCQLDPDDNKEAKLIGETFEQAMKRAAKLAVKASGGKAWVYKLVSVVEQTNFEALVEAKVVDEQLVLTQDSSPKEES